jgi:hypothetical protein
VKRHSLDRADERFTGGSGRSSGLQDSVPMLKADGNSHQMPSSIHLQHLAMTKGVAHALPRAAAAQSSLVVDAQHDSAVTHTRRRPEVGDHEQYLRFGRFSCMGRTPHAEIRRRFGPASLARDRYVTSSSTFGAPADGSTAWDKTH